MSTLKRIKEIEKKISDIKKLPREFRLMPPVSFFAIKGYDWRCDVKGNTLSYSHDEQFLLHAFRVMRKIALEKECCECGDRHSCEPVDKEFEKRMAKEAVK